MLRWDAGVAGGRKGQDSWKISYNEQISKLIEQINKLRISKNIKDNESQISHFWRRYLELNGKG